MGHRINAAPGKFKGYGLVRDKDGNPKFDDWNNIPEVFNPILTPEDWDYIYQQRKSQNGSNTRSNNS